MDVLLEHLKKLDCEYQIATSNGVVCSSADFEKVKNSKLVGVNMYSYDDKYYDKKTQFFEIDGIGYAISFYYDITKFAKEIMKSKIDCLTRLPNRTQIQQYLNAIKNECIIVMCDIDDFKKVNDTYGHSVGDDALRIIGALLKNAISENDFAGRYGGEEFLIIFDTLDALEAKQKMDKFNEVFNKLTRPISLTTSIGIHKYDPNNENVHEAIKKADAALYHVKGNGKNNSIIYEDIKIGEKMK